MGLDSPTSVPPEQLQEVVAYIDKMKDYDRSNFIKLQEINHLVWGMLFWIAGVLDYLFTITDRPEFSAIPWLLMSASGMALSLYINSRKSKQFLSEEVENITIRIKRMYRILVVLTAISWILMSILVSVYDLEFLIIPIVSFLIGSSILLFNYQHWNKKDLFRFYRIRNRLYFLPFLCYLASIINLVAYLIDPEFVVYMGLIMGILVGFGFGSGGFIGRT